MKYRAFNESRMCGARQRPRPRDYGPGAVKLNRRYGLLMKAMDLRRWVPRGTINENVKSVQLLCCCAGVPRCCLGPARRAQRAPHNYRYRARAPTAALIAPVQLSQRLNDRWWLRPYSLARSRLQPWQRLECTGLIRETCIGFKITCALF